MRPGRASRTAEHNALFRALEARRPTGRPIVIDRLAEGLLSPRYRLVISAARSPSVHHAVTAFIDRRWPGVRPTVLARTRLIDTLVAELSERAGQVVILGAGLDTRAWRLPHLAGVDVFEADHPDTQRWKQRLLRRRRLDPTRVRFIPTDFDLGGLDAEMRGAGVDPATPTLVLWEGTTNYLSADAVDATLRWCASSAPGSRLVFTYVDDAVLHDPSRFVGAHRLLSTLHRADEPMTFGLPPASLADYLAERGLVLASDVGAAEFRAACYGTASEAIRGHEFYRVALAEVPPTHRGAVGSAT